MATLQELRGLFTDSDLLEKVEVATVIAANNLLSGAPTTAEKAWAANVFSGPKSESSKALMSVLAANAALTTTALQGASDAAIQANVDSVVSVLVDAMAGV